MTKITVDKETIEQAIAGAVFDFAGYITSHPDTIEVGSTADASLIVQRIRAWAKHSGLSIGSANVESWNAVLAEVPVVEPVAHATVRSLQPDEYKRKVIVNWVNQPVTGPLFAAPPPPPPNRPPPPEPQWQISTEDFNSRNTRGLKW